MAITPEIRHWEELFAQRTRSDVGDGIAFVLGFERGATPGARGLDVALLARIGAWLAGGVVTALLAAAYRGSA